MAKTADLRYSIHLAASPRRVYKAFMDAEEHAAFTGYAARIDPREGGRFVTCGGRNRGYSLVLKQGRRIIQAWTQRSFAPHYTIIDIRLTKEEKGTRLEFVQTGIRPEDIHWLKPGWRDTYWKPLQRYFQ